MRSVIPTHLLAVSLRGAPLAAAIRLLSTRGWGLEVIDHMGPKHAVFEEHNLAISRRECNYLYVGDFLIGGTELRIAQIHARERGAELLHAAVIGNWLPTSVFKTTVGIDVCSLVELQTCGTDANFGFTS